MTVTYTSSLEGVTAEQLAGGFFEGWLTPPTPELHLALLRGSEAVVLAVDGEADGLAGRRVVGFVTAIGDGVLAASIPLLEVLPPWRGQGIGSELVRRIVAGLGSRYMVDLVCDDDLMPFYESLGFTRYRAMIRRDRAAIMTLRDRFGAHPGDPTHRHHEEGRP